ncbi:hypothetical protein HND73_26880, partial [Rhodococcus ruber]|nr:hypothetical protein [Rhodococcus ruber]
VGALAARLESHAGEGGRVVLGPRSRPERVPLSLAQSRMWFLNRFDPTSAAYNLPLMLRLTGRLDVAALQAAVDDVIARHEVLRTVYPEHDGVGYQSIRPAAAVRLDLDPVAVDESEIFARIEEFASAPFDVTADVPVRAQLLSVTDTDFVLLVVLHHISGDGFSMAPRTTPSGSARSSATRPTRSRWRPASSGTGPSGWPGFPNSWSCPPTGHGPRSRPTSAPRTGSRSTGRCRPGSRRWPARTAPPRSWWCTPPSRCCSRGSAPPTTS